jgi:hypothetical protein
MAELLEYIFRGPFGGIQSEVPLDAIETAGFADAVNIMFRKGEARTRFGYTPLPSLPPPAESPTGIFDFFAQNGQRIQLVTTPTRLLTYQSSSDGWQQVSGTLSGTDPMSFAVVGYRVLFSNGAVPVQMWDGMASSFSAPSANAVPAKYLLELAYHLVCGFTIEGGNALPQRIRWTAAGDPTDWTGQNAGTLDVFNDLGPITGLIKLYQTGYIFQVAGITQLIPTGIGTAPFATAPLVQRPKGCIAPRSIAVYGDQIAAYVGKDNIYVFNGTQSYPIGDAPVAGGRIGARRRIFAELALSDLNSVWGFISSSIAGNDYNCYWLVIPTGSVWVYNFDEGNWTRFVFDKPAVRVAPFAKAFAPRIMDLIGPISAQQWTPATLVSTVPLEGMAIQFTDGSLGYIDFTGSSETPWLLRTGRITFGDRMRNKFVTRLRLVLQDYGRTVFNITLTNQVGESQTVPIVIGTGTGLPLPFTADVRMRGYEVEIALSGQTLTGFNEIAPIYEIAGEFVNR